ncbi:DNA-directed RNA polymerase III subunit RPC3-like isoform X2 [Xenia sp. Carnegie-2017]|uniref:DNA-directed RNA polymerase III subunit RPC3-like isoform X2 n=2 Tax=Xenia sp. Carnegie-2017 TaxID=2897299 RepID=UPI001F03FE7D|nr:DNA-directed RNA polymerase III subunit RPC3-like isoform X2 [Xenia sp. Carnegie-2017]
MSAKQILLASLILEQHCGDIVARIGKNILNKGFTTLSSIALDTGFSKNKIRKALCQLIQHNLVKCQKNQRGFITYTGQLSNIFAIMYYPRFIQKAKMLFGDVAELIVEQLLLHGWMTMTSVVTRVTQRLHDPQAEASVAINEYQVSEQFANMASMHLLQHSTLESIDPSKAPPNESEKYQLPRAYTPTVSASHRRKASFNNDKISIDFQDSDIFWQVNIQQFNVHLVDEIIVDGTRNCIDEIASKVMDVMCKMTNVDRSCFSDKTKRLGFYEIAENLSHQEMSEGDLLSWLSILEQEKGGFVTKQSDSSGGLYAINIKNILHALSLACIESIIKENLGAKSFRIFNCLRMKGYLEQQQIEDFCMIPSKEAKELVYKLVEENFVNLLEVPRSADYAPSRTLYLFGVNVPQVCRMLLDKIYTILANIKIRQCEESKQETRLLEKSERLEGTISSLQSQGFDEDSQAVKDIREMMTDYEKERLVRLENIVKKCDHGEMQVTETLFVFSQFVILT